MLADKLRPANQSTCRARQQQLFSFLRSCKTLKRLAQIHTQIVINGFTQKNFILVKLLSIYIASGNLAFAQNIFENVQNPSTNLWNQIIRGYARSENPRKSIEIYSQMDKSAVLADGYTYSYVISGCVRSGLLREGEEVHGKVLKMGFGSNVFVQTNLVNLYCLIVGEGGFCKAWGVFEEMPERNTVTWNTLLLGCFKCGENERARLIFNEMPERNLVSWTVMIGGYAKNGKCNQALALFREMRRAGFHFDQVILVTVLSACAEVSDLSLGKWVHSYVLQTFSLQNLPVLVSFNNSLIHMYASCGAIEDAHKVFMEMPKRTTISWTSMITGFAKHGRAEEALNLFHQMERLRDNDNRPDEVTFLGVLCACSLAGYVDEGHQYFMSMSHDWGIEPRIEHYGCMVDLLSRAGLLDEAVTIVETMHVKPNHAVWGALLGGCQIHRNVELASHVAHELSMELAPERGAGYLILLSNIFANANRWRDVLVVRDKMVGMQTKISPGLSLIKADGICHGFQAGYRT